MLAGSRPIPVRFAGYAPPMRFGVAALLLAATLSTGLWLFVENRLGAFKHPAHSAMLQAARTMQAAGQVIREQKLRRGLLQPREVDHNQTGLIGPEFTEITTSLGILDAKRTATNPDLAAAVTRAISDLGLAPGSTVAIVLSGSLVGANIAAIAAVEALGLRPFIVSSIGASMFGATDPTFTWLDMEAALDDAGVIASRSALVIAGGGSGTGGGLGEDGLAAIRAAARRSGIPVTTISPLTALIEHLEEEIVARSPALLINAGGAVIALGTCRESDRLPAGLVTSPLPCSEGSAGLIARASQRGIPVLHLLNMRELAADWSLPYDPVPLPLVGNNRLLYGSPRSQAAPRTN